MNANATANIKAAIEVLRAARAYIDRGWCQRSYAAAEGSALSGPWHPRATCWCIMGALRIAAGSEQDEPRNHGMVVIAEALLFQVLPAEYRAVGVVGWQDAPGRTQSEVLHLFDQAIGRVLLAEAKLGLRGA